MRNVAEKKLLGNDFKKQIHSTLKKTIIWWEGRQNCCNASQLSMNLSNGLISGEELFAFLIDLYTFNATCMTTFSKFPCCSDFTTIKCNSLVKTNMVSTRTKKQQSKRTHSQIVDLLRNFIISNAASYKEHNVEVDDGYIDWELTAKLASG